MNIDILLSSETIQERVRQLGKDIRAKHGDEEIVLVGVMTGAVVFLGDLLRAIGEPARVAYCDVSSYGDNTVSSGKAKWVNKITGNINGAKVIIVEDIIDTGGTIDFLLNHLHDIGLDDRDVEVCSLLSKPSRRKMQVPITYCGFVIEDEFVVGYGLDHADKYRSLPFVGIIR